MINLEFICDNCGRSHDDTGSYLTDQLSRYMPDGWGYQRRFGFKNRVPIYCPLCTPEHATRIHRKFKKGDTPGGIEGVIDHNETA